jgi:hypothetical protein
VRIALLFQRYCAEPFSVVEQGGTYLSIGELNPAYFFVNGNALLRRPQAAAASLP